MTRIVILLQENKTPDYYFPTMAAWGAEIENRGHLRSALCEVGKSESKKHR
jgi:hypothetical protein